MKRVPGFLAAATLLSLAFATVAFAQQPQPATEGVVIKQRIIQRPEGGPPPPDATYVFMGAESFGGKTVKGAPYSAEAVTESIQTLADGNRIINRMTSSVYRDSEGRTRREQTLKGIGLFGGAGDEPMQTIFINDPVSGVTYTLNPRSRTAHKSVPFTFEYIQKAGSMMSGVEAQQFEFKVAPGAATESASGNVIISAPLHGAGVRVPHPGVGPEDAATFVFRSKTGNSTQVKEQLGKQIIEGVEAEGTRTTVTIPAGEIGNERPIEIVNERWYSPELQQVVMTRNSDPRFGGETTYKLTNINRVEQARSLFEIPAGYTVKEGPQFGPAVGPLRNRRPGHPE